VGKPSKRHSKVNILSQNVYGRITNYQVGNKSQTPNVCLIEFKGITSSSEAGKLVGQKVAWKSGKSLRVGQVLSLHGRNGMVRVRFNPGVPGQAIGTVVKLLN
jgi:large subunit ribosomal protein L35Ae